MSSPEQMVNVRYMVDDVQAAIGFYTGHLGFTLRSSAAPAFADVTRGNLRGLLAGPASSAGRPMPDGAKPGPGGWNRIHLIVPDIGSEVARLRAEGVSFRNEIVTGPGGEQILIEDPAGNVVELFEPASGSPARPGPPPPPPRARAPPPAPRRAPPPPRGRGGARAAAPPRPRGPRRPPPPQGTPGSAQRRPAAEPVSLATILREWGRIGCIGFGGPPAHI